MKSWTWNLGRVAGIPMRVHASFLLLIAWSVYSSLTGGDTLVGMALGVVFMLAVFASVLLHELGHALTARRFGISTESITLWPIGGVARLQGVPRTPRAEIWIAAAGPAVNLVLAVGIFGLQLVGAGLGLPAVLTGFVSSLWVANLALAVFNMLPAFPMDGGRVLRAALARSRGMLPATETAARIGKVFAVLFGVLGLVFDPMLLFIAVFVWFAGSRELANVRQLAARTATRWSEPRWGGPTRVFVVERRPGGPDHGPWIH